MRHLHGMLEKLKCKDEYTYQHCLNVSMFSRRLSTLLDNDICQTTFYVGILHDIGKLFIPDEILKKPEKLTSHEYNIIKTHSQHSRTYIESLGFNKYICQGVYHHHERFDGSGYPTGISGSTIPIS